MTRIKEITDYLDTLFPKETAENWDNPGLLTGLRDKAVTSVVLSLDVTSGAVLNCVKNGSNLLISHHPLIFGGIDNINEENVNGMLLSNMIKNDITNYAVHTNLDVNAEYSNSILAQKLGAVKESITVLENTSCGVYCELKESVKLGDFMKDVTSKLDSTGCISINNPDTPIRKLFVQGGSFDEDSISAVKESGAELVLSGEIKHHITLLLAHMGITSVIAGHNATERVFMENLCEVLKNQFPDVDFTYDKGIEKALI